MSDESREIIEEFLVESFENMDRLDQELVLLETNPSDEENITSIFRRVHTVKGTCGFLEFNKLESITHVGETLLDSLRAGRVKMSQTVATALMELSDAMRAILLSIEQEKNEGQVNYSTLIQTLKALNVPKGSESSKEDELETAFMQAMSERDGNTTTIIELPTELPSSVVASSTPLSSIQGSNDSAPTAVSSGSSAEDTHKSQLAETSLRVDVNILDALMNLVGELVLIRNQILQYTKGHQDTTFLGASQRLNLITSELQEGVMRTRMQPIANVWNKFPRIVRDVAKMVNKEVRLEMEGKETDLDKTIIEAIKDPLTHIVRNSVDHGIEPPQKRIAAGKPAEGVITLKAYHEGGYVIIEIIDDGAGLQTEKIKQKALEKGIITAEKLNRMSEQEVHRLIFAPGFSTADQVTNISGRGVGMDVVRSNIEKIGGHVDIISTQGHGSTIKIKIPLTLAIVPTLIISSGGERFAIPQVNLVELVRVHGEQIYTKIEEVHGANFFRLRGDLLPLVYLNKELGLKASIAAESIEDAKINIVVVKADEQQFGVVVDTIHDMEEIVVKPLGKQLKNISVLSGATIMGDGHVALILDVLGLGRLGRVLSQSQGDSETAARAVDHESIQEEPKQSLLIVQAADGYRAGIPLKLVKRLEEFSTASIELSGGFPAVQYRDGILPLVDLPEYFGSTNCNKDEIRHVVVYESGKNRFGFVVSKILDIVEERISMQNDQRRPGTLGSAVIQRKVTDLLDLDQIIGVTRPNSLRSNKDTSMTHNQGVQYI